MSDKPIPSMPFDDMYAGRFLKAGNLRGKVLTLTVVSFTREMLQGEKGPKPGAVFLFKETFKGVPIQIVLSKLNATCVKAMFGADLATWVGRRITFFPTDRYAPIKVGQECLRIAGSPDIDQDIDVTIALTRRKAFVMTLRKTVRGAAVPPPAPSISTQTGASDAPDDDDDEPISEPGSGG